jgi:penicillin-binding protein 1A
LKLVRVNLKTGLRAAPNDPKAITEAFKPNEEPDDAYSIIGFQLSEEAGAAANAGSSGDAYTPSSGNGWSPTQSAPPGYSPAPRERRPPGSVW